MKTKKDKLKVELDKKNILDSFRKTIQYHLTKKEQKKLVNELLKQLPEPTELMKLYAKIFSTLNSEGGYVNATEQESWLMAKKDYVRKIEREELLEGKLIKKTTEGGK